MFEYAEHTDDIRVLEFSQRLCFAHKAFQAPAKDVFLSYRYGLNRAVTAARGEFMGEVFLDRDQLSEIIIPGQVGDAKAAATQDRLDLLPEYFKPGL